MEIKTRNKSYKKILAIGIIVIALALSSYAVYAKVQNEWPFASESTSSNSTDPTISDETYVDSDSDANTAGSAPTSADNPKAPARNNDPDTSTSSDPVNSSSIKLSITYIRPSGDSVKLGTNIESITNSATCTLTVTSEAGVRAFSDSVGTQALPNSSTCKGFSIPKASVESGVFNYKVTVREGSESGSTTEKYEVK